MKHSLFWKLMLFLLCVELLVEGVALAFMYQWNYSYSIKNSEDDLRHAAAFAASAFRAYDPYNLDDSKNCESVFQTICDSFELPYIYAIKPNVETRDEKYLAFSFGVNAIDELKGSRYAGYVAEGTLTDEEIAAFEGDDSGIIVTEKSQFGNTMICYMPVLGYYDSTKYEFVDDDIVSIIGVEMYIDSVTQSFERRFAVTAILSLSITAALTLAIALILYFRISRPLKQISRRMTGFVSDRGKNRFEQLPVKGKDEIAEVSSSFNKMAGEIDMYLSQLSELNRQKAELQIARDIQMGLLEPSRFCHQSAFINAYIKPARDIGGDLYDYQVLSDGKLCILIADVSGKGVSAALFMSRAVTLLHMYAESGLSPARILHEYNDHLADRNPNTLFITTFVGIYDPDTEVLTYSNAGHNDPYLLSDSLITLDGEHGMAAGVFKDESYQEFSVKVKKGDTLLLYTDGVTESKNTSSELFGEERLEATLREQVHADGDAVINAVLHAIETFSDGAEQNDDITMMTLHLSEGQHTHLHLAAKKENLTEIITALSALGLAEDDFAQLRMIAEEMFVNICSYAYPGGEGDAELLIDREQDKVILTFIDSGEAFDPTADVLEIEDYDIDNSVGGLGRFLTFSIADAYLYRRADNKNILRIEKQIASIDPADDTSP